MSERSEFYIAIQGVLKSWTALQLAVSHGLGGQHSAEKAQWFVGVIETYFAENDSLEDFEVEEFISQIMNEEFDTVLEDNSPYAIAKEICQLYGLWSRNNLEELRNKIKAMPQVNLAECVYQGDDEDEPMAVSNEEETMASLNLATDEVETQNQNNGAACSSRRQVQDEDGWTTIVTRSKSKKKSGG